MPSSKLNQKDPDQPGAVAKCETALQNVVKAENAVAVAQAGKVDFHIDGGSTRVVFQQVLPDLAVPIAPTNPKPVSNVPPSPQPFLGREADISLIIEKLRAEKPAASQTLGIYGKIGVGKSTFLAHFAWREVIQKQFQDGIYWAALGQNPVGVSSMLRDWCRLARVDATGLLPAEMASRLGETFLGRQILLVVDDVWRGSDLGLVQRLLHPTVQLVFTSRLPGVAHEIAAGNTYQLRPLDETASLQLLRFFAESAVDTHPKECRELVQALEGLPLALQVAGRLLVSQERLGLGVKTFIGSLQKDAALLAKKVPPNMGAFLDEANQNATVAELFRKSVDFLPPSSQKCFFCLGAMAPKPATFDFEAIKDVWFFVEDPIPVLSELVDTGLLEPLSNGRFQMHAMLVAYAKWRLEGVDSLEDL